MIHAGVTVVMVEHSDPIPAVRQWQWQGVTQNVIIIIVVTITIVGTSHCH